MSAEKVNAPAQPKTGLLATIWPIEKFEKRKVLPLILLMFLMTFNYTLLRDLKDVLVLDAMVPSSILFLKCIFVMMFSVVFMFAYNKMSSVMSKPAVFYTVMLIFIGFFAFFGGVLNVFKSSLVRGTDELNKLYAVDKKIIAEMFSKITPGQTEHGLVKRQECVGGTYKEVFAITQNVRDNFPSRDDFVEDETKACVEKFGAEKSGQCVKSAEEFKAWIASNDAEWKSIKDKRGRVFANMQNYSRDVVFRFEQAAYHASLSAGPLSDAEAAFNALKAVFDSATENKQDDYAKALGKMVEPLEKVVNKRKISEAAKKPSDEEKSTLKTKVDELWASYIAEFDAVTASTKALSDAEAALKTAKSAESKDVESAETAVTAAKKKLLEDKVALSKTKASLIKTDKFYWSSMKTNENAVRILDDAMQKSAIKMAQNRLTEDDFLYGIKVIFYNWTAALLYVMSEMWGTVVLSLLFYSFTNDICPLSEAKRFYPVINLGANLSLILCGLMLGGMGMSGGNTIKEEKQEKEKIMLFILMSCVCAIGVAIMFVYRHMQKNVLTDPMLYDPNLIKPKKKKAKMGMVAGLKLVFSSSYIFFIAMLVLMYGCSVNFMEVYSKSAAKNVWSTLDPLTMTKELNQSEMLAWTGFGSLVTGAVVMSLLLFIGGRAVKTMGWTFTAAITPVVLIVTAIPFMFLNVAKKNRWEMFGISASYFPVMLMLFGFVAVVASKSFKYSFFDPTKEMAYIPLDEDLKVKGKAAVDVVAARLGKSLSGYIQIGMMFFLGTSNIDQYVEAIFACMFISVGSWLFSVFALGKKFNALTSKPVPKLTA